MKPCSADSSKKIKVTLGTTSFTPALGLTVFFKSNMRNPNWGSPLHNILDNSELKIINIVKFNVVVKDQTQLNRYNSELEPPTSKF